MLEQEDIIVNFKLYTNRKSRLPFPALSFLRPSLPFPNLVLATLSGPGGATFRILEAKTGILLMELPLHSPLLGKLNAPVDGGSDIAFLGSQWAEDVLVLTNSRSVTRISMEGGFDVWKWSASDDT